jgi:hypothetical protein
MAEFTTRDVTQIFYKDWGAGQQVEGSRGSRVTVLYRVP